MKPIQFILMPAILLALAFYFGKLRTRTFDRTLVLLVGGAGAVMLAFPSLTTVLARLVGVNRGADLLFYLALIAGAMLTPMFYLRLRAIDQRFTALVRALAIQQASPPSNIVREPRNIPFPAESKSEARAA
jgi:hypothetical protein